MNCDMCNINKIGPKTQSQQCQDCNSISQGHCALCQDKIKFEQMTRNPVPESLASAQVRIARSAVGQPPTAPFLSNSSSQVAQRQSTNFMSQALMDDIETQSNISQEHLSMDGSKESQSMMHECQQDTLTDSSTNVEKASTIRIKSKRNLTKPTASVGPEQLQKFNEMPQRNVESVGECHPDLRCGLVHHHCGDSIETNSVSNGRAFVSVTQHNRMAIEVDSNENAVVIQEDPDDNKVIHTSQLRFMDSTESMNYLVGESIQKKDGMHLNQIHARTTPAHAYVVTTENGVHVEPLSTNVLRDFDRHNTAHSSETVENYLKTYGPVTYYHFPNYNCPHRECHYSWNELQQQQQQQPQRSQMKSTSVSTDSEPRLEPQKSASADSPTKCETRDYVVMQTTTGMSRLQKVNVEYVDKFGRPSLDMRMQKILKTFLEDPQTGKLDDESGPTKGNFIKFSSPNKESAQATPQKYPLQQHVNVGSRVALEDNGDSVVLRLLNSHHALYQPVSNLHTRLTEAQPAGMEPPPPQFQLISCYPAAIQELTAAKAPLLNRKPLSVCMRNIPRVPIQCPESTCQRMIFVSDFNKHLVVDHNHLSLERLTPFQCKNFFIDPRLARCNSSKCHTLYLLQDKLIDLGSSKYKDFLPVLIMTSRVSLHQVCGMRWQQTTDVGEFLVIWVTGIVPEEFPISVSLTVWPRSGKMPLCHMVYSGEIYSIRSSQQGFDVWQSGRMLMLTGQEVDRLTNGGKDMLNMQLVVH